MKDNLKDILSNLNPDIDQETLLLYLQGKLSSEEQHQLEKKMLDGDFESDAMDGLQHFQDKKKINLFVEQINQELRKKTTLKRKKRKSKELHLDPSILIALVLILILAVVSFFVILKMR